MEPKNGGLEDDLFFSTGDFQVPAVSFHGLCQAHSAVLWFNGGWKALLTTSWFVVVWVSQTWELNKNHQKKIVEKPWNIMKCWNISDQYHSPVIAMLYLIWSVHIDIHMVMLNWDINISRPKNATLDAGFLVVPSNIWDEIYIFGDDSQHDSSETEGTEGENTIQHNQHNPIVSTPLPTKALTHTRPENKLLRIIHWNQAQQKQ